MHNQYTTMVHDFGLRGYHIMNRESLQPTNSFRGNGFMTMNREANFESLPYFYKNIKSSDEATKFIKSQQPRPGQFIVRKSSKGKDYLSITVELSNRNIKHINIKIEKDEHGLETFCLLQELGNFTSLDILIEYYKIHPIDNIEKVKDVKLLHPIIRKNYDSDSILDGVVLENFHGPLRMTSSVSNISLENRPPAQLPPNIVHQTGMESQSSFYYTYVRNVDEDRSKLLWHSIEMEEKCKCGIRLQDSQLPDNFTVHQIQDPKNGRKLYFQDNNKMTAWILPDNIIRKLEPFHWNNLAKLYAPRPLPDWLRTRRAILLNNNEG